MLSLDPNVADIVTLASGGVAVLALLVALAAVLRGRRLRRTLSSLRDHGGGGSLLDVVTRQAGEVRRLGDEVAATAAAIERVRADMADALRHVAVVRYDAFQDMGGRMSFSAALLDDSGDGIVITAINGRSETRAYAKGVRAGASDHTLSPEEQQAIEHALRDVRAGGVTGGMASGIAAGRAR